MTMMKNSALVAALVDAPLTRSITVEQINANRGGAPLRRQAAVRNIDEEARTVQVAFSSEEPVPRWFGDEVLDHSPGAMLETRLQNGAAVLWNHDTDVQIGVVEAASIDGDRRGRATLRFGRSARAEEIWNDIVDGVIRHISVGYFVRAIKTEEREGERDKVTITEWEPYEISLVSVPADATVGVGRGAGEPPEEAPPGPANTGEETTATETEGSGMETKILRNANGDLVRAKVDENGNIIEVVEVLERAADTQALVTRGTQAEQQRTADLLELGEQYSAQQLAAEAIRNNMSVDEFTRSLLDHVSNNDRADRGGNQPLDDNPGQIGLTDAEVRQFSFLRCANAMLNPTDRSAQEAAAFEFEASRAAEQSMGRTAQGMMVPVDVLTRALNTSTDGLAPGNTGGFFVDTTLMTQSFIELLRNRSVFLQMATPMGGLIGNLDIPGQASGGNTFWVGEDEDVDEGGYEGRLVSMSPKTIGVFGEVTRRMAMQTSLDVEARFRASLARDLGLGIDYAGFYGTGGANMPLGINNQAGINAVEFGALQPSYLELVAMETEVSADNADVDSMAYVGNSRFRGHCKSTQKFVGTNGMPIWEAGNTVNGTNAEITNQIALGDVFYGNFADANVGMWGALDILIDPYTKGRAGTRRVILHQDVDISVNNVESFCVGRDAG
ncbi:phage major capsid protein [uncultured Tateyamaria sp.]|uniref:phage major capsid protein n=1 Tax=uncultured Tateyamaria sp. TaxID=455651 RepID=UPI00261C1A35|nr:phage major capsid protein [uncultured Tateyamaria sp.]